MDLGKPERFMIPGISFGIPILAIIVVATSYLQSKVMAPPANDPSAQQMGMMNIYMPLMMGYFAYSFASGLALYFVVSNILTVIQYTALALNACLQKLK